MYERILAATDGSEEADRAVDHAIDIAEQYGATVHALYVANLSGVGDDTIYNLEDQRDALEQEGNEVIADAAERAREQGVDVVTAIKWGSPARTINGYVDRNEIDLVVMGTRGKTGATRILLGSVAERTVRTVPVPVLTVGPGENPGD